MPCIDSPSRAAVRAGDVRRARAGCAPDATTGSGHVVYAQNTAALETPPQPLQCFVFVFLDEEMFFSGRNSLHPEIKPARITKDQAA